MSEPEFPPRTRSRTIIKAAPATAGAASGPYSPAVDLDSRQPSGLVVMGPERFRAASQSASYVQTGVRTRSGPAKGSRKASSTLDGQTSGPAISGSESQLGIVARTAIH